MTTSIDHIGLNVTDYDKAKAFYVAALAPLGLKVLNDFGVVIGMGADFPFLWVSAGNPGHAHLAFRADSRKLVDDFYAAAISAGGRDNGAPGVPSCRFTSRTRSRSCTTWRCRMLPFPLYSKHAVPSQRSTWDLRSVVIPNVPFSFA